ncbi:MAG: phosphatase [Crocinitomicaceae bacterium]|nr:phosphatase [Crocinitomicaceae bacterium]|tara:strand:+ start:7275 stop:7829 length:555 start_codon:yes stop_codon:yes gene_type:complete
MLINKWGIDNTWTLFLDRDGVINERIFGGYVTKISEFVFLENSVQAIATLSNFFGLTFVVTNQQGIGKGIMTEGNLLDIHTYMCNEIVKNGGMINKCFFASNLIGDENDFRKPKPKMGELAKFEFPKVNFERSLMVGDTDTDIEFGKNLGMRTVRIKTEEPIGIEADLTVSSLFELSKIFFYEV